MSVGSMARFIALIGTPRDSLVVDLSLEESDVHGGGYSIPIVRHLHFLLGQVFLKGNNAASANLCALEHRLPVRVCTLNLRR